MTYKWRVEVNNFKKQHEIELYDREKSYLRRNREMKIEKKRDIMKKRKQQNTHTHTHTHTHTKRERERLM